MISVAWYWSEMILDGRTIASSKSTGWKRWPLTHETAAYAAMPFSNDRPDVSLSSLGLRSSICQFLTNVRIGCVAAGLVEAVGSAGGLISAGRRTLSLSP